MDDNRGLPRDSGHHCYALYGFRWLDNLLRSVRMLNDRAN